MDLMLMKCTSFWWSVHFFIIVKESAWVQRALRLTFSLLICAAVEQGFLWFLCLIHFYYHIKWILIFISHICHIVKTDHKYNIEVANSGIIFIPSFVKISLSRNWNGTHACMCTHSTIISYESASFPFVLYCIVWFTFTKTMLTFYKHVVLF
jgi:hypothetical protein